MTWVQIVNDYLKKNGFDCIKSNNKECYCKIGNLFDCAFDCETFNCTAGKIADLPAYFTMWDEDDYE
jgi:hypothetical protein